MLIVFFTFYSSVLIFLSQFPQKYEASQLEDNNSKKS